MGAAVFEMKVKALVLDMLNLRSFLKGSVMLRGFGTY